MSLQYKLVSQRNSRDDILVFLTGREEIEFAVKKVKEINAVSFYSYFMDDLCKRSIQKLFIHITRGLFQEMKHKLHPVPLYSALPPKTQMAVFQPAPCVHFSYYFLFLHFRVNEK